MKLTLKYLKESAARKAYNGLTRLRAWWPIVNQNFIDIETAINTLGDDISTEAEARKEADKRLIGEFEDFGEFIASSDDEDGVFNATDAEGLSNIPTERLFKLRNNTNSTITTLQLLPHLHTLSKPVMKDQEVICLKSNQTGELKMRIFVFSEDMASLADISSEAKVRETADNAIANGTRVITPNLGDNTQYGNINLGKKELQLYGPMYNGANSLQEMAAQTAAARTAISMLNGNDDVNGSVDKKIKDALTAFAAELPASATAAEIREAWNPTPVTPTVTITGQYGYPDTLTISDESDMNKLLALEEGEAFTLIISATDVEQSGNSKWLEHIRSFTYPATSPGYDISSVTLWDNEVGTFTMFECIMRAQTTLTDGVRTFGTIDVTSY